MIKKLPALWRSSLTFQIYSFFSRNVLTLPLYRFLTDFSYFSQLWHNSQTFHFLSSKILRFFSPPKPGSLVKGGVFRFCAAAVSVIYLLPQKFIGTETILIFSLCALLFRQQTAGSPAAFCDVFLFTVFAALFTAMLRPVLDSAAFAVIANLIGALSFYLSFSLKTTSASWLQLFSKWFYMLTAALCGCYMLCLLLGVKDIYLFKSSFSETLILLTFPALSYAVSLHDRKKRLLAANTLLAASLFSIISSGTNIAAVGFCVSAVIFTALACPTALIFLLVLAPTLVLSSLMGFIEKWSVISPNAPIAENIVLSAASFWQSGIGAGSAPFISLYGSAAAGKSGAALSASSYAPYARIYSEALIGTGFFCLAIMLRYSLRLIRSAIFLAFTAKREMRPYFWAGLCSLVGISVSGLITASSLSFKSLLAYHSVLAFLSVCKTAQLEDLQ